MWQSAHPWASHPPFVSLRHKGIILRAPTRTATNLLPDTHTNREAILDFMARRCTSSLDHYLGTYRIVWDSQSNLDPREPVSTGADLRDGILTLARPQRAPEWPKEPPPALAASTAVLQLQDSFLGADRTASKLSPSPSPSPSTSLATSSSSTSSSSFDSLHSTSTTSRSKPRGQTRFWRFDWDPTFPRLGYRFEGMDLTSANGHTLSFSELLDDRGRPFAVLELRPSAYRGPSHKPDYITVVAKWQRNRYTREGLTENERQRLGMMDLGGE